MTAQQLAELNAPIYANVPDYYYVPQLGSVGYSYLAFCPDCGEVIDMLESNPDRKVECADHMYFNWYVKGIPWQRVTREYADSQRVGCLCVKRIVQLALPGFIAA